LTPLLLASSSAFAIGAEVNEYACTTISLTAAAVTPPHGEKYTSAVPTQPESALHVQHEASARAEKQTWKRVAFSWRQN
jgi:hypothetical protein